MKELTEKQKKEIDIIKKKMFEELEKEKAKDSDLTLDSGQGNPIISKYKKEIKKVIENSTK